MAGGRGGRKDFKVREWLSKSRKEDVVLCVMAMGLVGSRWFITKRDGEAMQP